MYSYVSACGKFRFAFLSTVPLSLARTAPDGPLRGLVPSGQMYGRRGCACHFKGIAQARAAAGHSLSREVRPLPSSTVASLPLTYPTSSLQEEAYVQHQKASRTPPRCEAGRRFEEYCQAHGFAAGAAPSASEAGPSPALQRSLAHAAPLVPGPQILPGLVRWDVKEGAGAGSFAPGADGSRFPRRPFCSGRRWRSGGTA